MPFSEITIECLVLHIVQGFKKSTHVINLLSARYVNEVSRSIRDNDNHICELSFSWHLWCKISSIFMSRNKFIDLSESRNLLKLT